MAVDGRGHRHRRNPGAIALASQEEDHRDVGADRGMRRLYVYWLQTRAAVTQAEAPALLTNFSLIRTTTLGVSAGT